MAEAFTILLIFARNSISPAEAFWLLNLTCAAALAAKHNSSATHVIFRPKIIFFPTFIVQKYE